jgi:putative serine protease PepD
VPNTFTSTGPAAFGAGSSFGSDPFAAPTAPSAQLGGRAPVADDARPPGAPRVPPTSWPDPRLPATGPAPEAHKPRRTALYVFTAFLVGAAMVGAAFAAYAVGDRRDEQAAASTTTTSRPLRATGELDIQKILDIARPSVVTIQTGGPNSLFGGAGTGVIIEDGLILTNAHVIEGAGNEISVRFNDESTAEAKLIGASTGDDIALIQVDRTDLTPATLGSSNNLLVGDPVVAIGNALNLGVDPSVTSGIVSAKNRQISDGTINLDNLIQTDAAINPGNSGGPLVNANGEVVGINTAIIAGSQNIGFSIAIDSVRDLIKELKAGGGDLTSDTATIAAPTMDVSSPELPQEAKDQFGITAEQGAVVIGVDPNGAGSAAGLQVGDVITVFDGAPVSTSNELTRMVRSHDPGDQVTMQIERRGRRQALTITLGP